MKDILKIAQHNFTKPDFHKSSQFLKRKTLALAKQLGIHRLEDLRHNPLFSSHLSKAIKFTESGRHVRGHNLYIQIIFSILNALQRRRSNAQYQDILDIRNRNEIVQMKDRNIAAQKQQIAKYVDKMNGLQEQLGQSEHQRNELQGQLGQSENQRNGLQEKLFLIRDDLKQEIDQYEKQIEAEALELENAQYEFENMRC